MTTSKYDQVLKMIKCLNLSEQVQLLETLSHMVRDQMTEVNPHSIMELEGLGAEVCQGIDTQAYVDHERALWESRQ